MTALWIIILLVVLSLSGYLAGGVLPRAFLTLRYTVKKSEDRCIKRVYEHNGQSMVFEPEVKWRKYVKQYVLSERKEKKQLMLRVDENLSYIVYDVAVFNSRNEVEKVIKVKDYVDKKGYCKVVDLPEETSYVSIQVLRADNELFEDHLTAKVPAGKTFKFICVSALVVIIETVWIKICVSNILGGVFRESFVLSVDGLLVSLMIAGIAIVVNTLVSLVALAVRKSNFTVKVKNNA